MASSNTKHGEKSQKNALLTFAGEQDTEFFAAALKAVSEMSEEVAKMRGNMEHLKELWKKWDDCGPAKAFVQQLDDLIHGNPLSFYPNCQMCEECDGDPNCPWCGEPDGCNNRELRTYILEHEKENQ